MELNDLVKMLVKAENPRQQAIERAQATKAAPKGATSAGTIYIPMSGTQQEFQWVVPSDPNWTTITTSDSTNTGITTATTTNALTIGSSGAMIVNSGA